MKQLFDKNNRLDIYDFDLEDDEDKPLRKFKEQNSKQYYRRKNDKKRTLKRKNERNDKENRWQE
jgi:hypothetical protein